MIKLSYQPGKLLVGLSGGADSMALLHLLMDAGCNVTAVHVNHGLRGDASDGDEAFVREVCKGMRIPVLSFRALPPDRPGEGWAREARYGFFRQAMAQTQADALVLAHHRDDQAETLLLHLLRGAGLTGLTGMTAETMLEGLHILRPLLPYGRDELRAYLTERGIAWREDASNSDVRYLRNALRLQVLPTLERLAPGASARMAMTASCLQEDDAALDILAANFLELHAGLALPLNTLQRCPRGLQKRILRRWWTANAPLVAERSLSACQTDNLLALLDAPVSARCNLPQGWHGQRGWTHIHLVPPEVRSRIREMPAQACSLLVIEPFTGEPGNGHDCQAIPRAWLTACTVRSRQKGDFIRPFGSTGSQSLQDYFVNRRIDAAFRDQVPLLCRGSEVLLAGGVGAGGIPYTDDMDDPVLLRWVEAFPWQRTEEGGNYNDRYQGEDL